MSGHVTRDQLLEARRIAGNSIAEAAKGVVDSGDMSDGHSARSFPVKLQTAVDLFLAHHDGDRFEHETLFAFLKNLISDEYVSRSGRTAPQSAATVRENIAVTQHLLNALDLKQEFHQYQRSTSIISR